MDIDGTPGVSRIDMITARRAAPRVRSDEAGEFARVYELADVRRRRMTGPDRIPAEVWADMARAHDLADDLAEHGREVRFETHHLTGRVVASLTRADGTVVRPMGLDEVVGIDPDPASAA